jgi:hypothetical protein
MASRQCGGGVEQNIGIGTEPAKIIAGAFRLCYILFVM